MKKRGEFILFTILLIFIISFVSTESIADNLHVNIQTVNASDDIISGTFKFEFNITTDSGCSDVVYSNFSTLTTNSRGIVSYYLEDVNLNYSDQYWLCFYRDGTLVNASKIARTPYSFVAKNVSAEGIINDSNIDLTGKNITSSTGFFSFLGDLVTRITSLFVQDIDFTGKINGSGNINTTGNVTANYFIGDGSLLTGISGSGDFSFTDFHDSFVLNSTVLNNTKNIQELLNDTGIYSTYNETYENSINSMISNISSINTTANVQNLINGTNMNFADVDFNNGWLTGGVSIIGGDLYAQTVYVYNISSLSITNLNVNGSMIPAFDNQFDLGNSSARWNNLYVSGDIHSNGTLILSGIDITAYNETNLINSINTTKNIQELYNVTASQIANLSISQSELSNYWGSNGSNIYNDTTKAVGIGTKTPSNLLDIYGGGLAIISALTTGTSAPANGIFSEGGINIGGTGSGELYLYESTPNDESTIRMANADTGGGSTDGIKLSMYTGNSFLFWLYENLPIIFATNNLESFRINPNGVLNASQNITTAKYFNGLWNGSYLYATNLTVSQIANLSISQSGLSNFWDSNGSNIYNETAYVGIGTSNPAYSLEIANSVTALNVSGILYANSSNVGIGTFSPIYKLEINGTMNVSTSNAELRVDENGINILV